MAFLNKLRRLTQRLPGVREAFSYGMPALKVGKNLFVRLHQEEDAIVVVLESVEEQAPLIASDPDHFYITDHYTGYAAVLVRPTLAENALFELLKRAWRRVARKADIREYLAGSSDR